jgi:hypothetical protein
MHVLELHVDEILQDYHSRSSRFLRLVFANGATSEHGSYITGSSIPASPRNLHDDVFSVEGAIDTGVYAQLGGWDAPDLLVHVLAILRCVPLATLYHSAGWQTDVAGTIRAKDQLRAFFRNKTTSARKCLWHAAIVYTELRKGRQFACYDSLNIWVAVCYIGSYATLGPEKPTQAPSVHRPNNRTSVQNRAIRLDKLTKRNEVEKWFNSGAEGEVHITGVGLLRGANSHTILLNDVSKILMKQVSWPGLCQALARAFIKITQGGVPDADPEQQV